MKNKSFPPTVDELLNELKKLENDNIHIKEYKILCLHIIIQAIKDYVQYGMETDSKKESKIFLDAKEWLFTNFQSNIKNNITSLNYLTYVLNLDIETVRRIALKAREMALEGTLKTRKTKDPVKNKKQLDMFLLFNDINKW